MSQVFPILVIYVNLLLMIICSYCHTQLFCCSSVSGLWWRWFRIKCLAVPIPEQNWPITTLSDIACQEPYQCFQVTIISLMCLSKTLTWACDLIIVKLTTINTVSGLWKILNLLMCDQMRQVSQTQQTTEWHRKLKQFSPGTSNLHDSITALQQRHHIEPVL